jgi:hypothetical protein
LTPLGPIFFMMASRPFYSQLPEVCAPNNSILNYSHAMKRQLCASGVATTEPPVLDCY